MAAMQGEAEDLMPGSRLVLPLQLPPWAVGALLAALSLACSCLDPAPRRTARHLLLTRYIGVESGPTIRMAPNVERASQRPLLSGFFARTHEAGTRPQTAEAGQEAHLALESAPSPRQPAGLSQSPSGSPSKFLISSR
jgi:hypothetical protein